MTTASDVLHRAESLGIRVWASEGRLLYTPKNVPADMLDALRERKPELLRLLTPDLADSLEKCIELGARLANGEIAALRCGITGNRCVACRGIPCLGSTPLQ